MNCAVLISMWTDEYDLPILEPNIIPFQVSGTIDTDLSKVTASKLMAWASQISGSKVTKVVTV